MTPVISFVLVAPILAATVLASAPSPSPRPLPQGIDFAKKDRDTEACAALATSYKAERQAADFALRNCQLHVFFAACSKAKQLAADIKKPDSPCREILEKKNLSSFVDIQCEIVKVPAAARCGQQGQ